MAYDPGCHLSACSPRRRGWNFSRQRTAAVSLEVTDLDWCNISIRSWVVAFGEGQLDFSYDKMLLVGTFLRHFDARNARRPRQLGGHNWLLLGTTTLALAMTNTDTNCV